MANDPSDKVRQLSGALPSAPPKQAPAGDMARGGTPKNYVQTPPTHGGHEQQPDGGRGHATATVIDGKAIKGAPGANPMAPPTQLKAGHGSQNVPIHPHMTDAQRAAHDPTDGPAMLGEAVKSGSTDLSRR